MRHFGKRVIALVLSCIAVVGMSTVAFANSDTIVQITRQEDVTKARTAGVGDGNDVSPLKTLDKTYKAFTANTANATLQIKYNGDLYDELDEDEQKKAVEQALNTVAGWGLSDKALNSILDAFRDTVKADLDDSRMLQLLFADTKADLGSALQIFKPFSGAFGTILGIGVVILVLLLVLSSVFDLVYIGLPQARMAMDGKAEESGKAKPKGVSYDAIQVVRDEDKINGNLYWAYLKRRFVTYIVLFICILFLIGGEIAGLIGWMLDLVSGIGG